jgi:small subunit ribosomal protein S7
MINQILGKKKFQLLLVQRTSASPLDFTSASLLAQRASALLLVQNWTSAAHAHLLKSKNSLMEKQQVSLLLGSLSVPNLIIPSRKFSKNSKLKDFNLTKNTTDFDLLFKKCTNFLMIHGKKTKASKILFDMLLILKKTLKKENKSLFLVISQALENLVPNLEVRKVRVAGSTYSVPSVLSKKKQETLALKWIIESAKKRQKNSKLDFSACLADEILEASRKSGQALKKRDELHRLAQTNRAYSRYRWW